MKNIVLKNMAKMYITLAQDKEILEKCNDC